MKKAPVLAAFALALVLVPGVPGAASAHAAPATPAAAPLPPPLPQKGEQDFKLKFRELMKIKAYDEMANMVQKRQQDAVLAIMSTCEGISIQPTDQLEELMAALRRAWKKSVGSKFVDIQYEYFSLLDARYKKTRRQLIQRWRLKHAEFSEAVKAKDKNAFPGIGLDFKGFAESFEQIGDWYMASECWWSYASCFDEEQRGKKEADLKRACEGYGRMVAGREKIDLRDGSYNRVKPRFENLEALGHGDPSKSKVKPAVTEAASGAALTIPTTFEAVEDINAYARPSYTLDDLYPVWTYIFLKGKGTDGTIRSLGDLSPKVLRESVSKVSIDADGDGTGEVDIPTKGKMTLISFEIGTGDEKRPVAFLATVGTQKDTFQGFEMDLGPRDESVSIYICPAGSMTGMVGETPIRILDDNLDGFYGSKPLQWGYDGLRDKSFQLDSDSVVVGDEKRARPWSEYMEIGGTWYKLEAMAGGTSIQAEPMEVVTGTIKVKVKGIPKPDWLIVQGENDFERCYYDVMAGGSKGIEVPRGTYVLSAGRISKGKRLQKMKALILPAEGARSYSVSEGETTTIELGGPFGFDFDYAQGSSKINITGKSIVVTGALGETYQRLWNCVPQPVVNFRKKGGKRGSKLKKLHSAGSQQEMTEGWGPAWYPFDEEIDKKKKGDKVELQLFEKKNKLFGKIESEWR